MTDTTKAGTPASATLIIGLSGAGKSSLLATAAEYGWETFRKVSLYYLSDGGGFPTQIQALIRLGIVRLWRLRSRSGEGLAFETCQRASQGWWPARINPLTGDCEPNARLVPPITERFEMFCPNGHLVVTVPFASLLTNRMCPTCQTMVDARTRKVHRTAVRTRGFEDVGLALYDGLSSMCSWMLGDLSERAGELGGEKSRLGGTVTSGDITWGENNRAQVGFTQNRAEQLILNAQSIPGLVIPPIWTALTHETTDEGGLTVRGPLIAGQAKTSVAPQWVGNLLEAIVVERQAKKYRRLNLNEYVDERGTRHLCKVRGYPGLMPAHLEDEDSDEATARFENFSLGRFHTLLDSALEKTELMYQGKYTGTPGVPEGLVEYGEENLVVQPTASTPPPTSSPTTGHAGVARPRATAPPVKRPTGTSVPATAVTATPSPVGASPSPVATGPVPVTPPPPRPPVRATTSAPPPGRRRTVASSVPSPVNPKES